ncbi:MAG: glycosyltransferase family 2 protein, partial [Deltaproteobacteria bacterium]|nr:glycosyltransferase family 2 protein [Deltaproteobacteria bacterium]
YVDIGVFFADNRNLTSCARNENEGIRYVLQASRYLIKSRKYFELPHLFLDSAARFIGYRVGSHYRIFTPRIMKTLSMNRNYWADA